MRVSGYFKAATNRIETIEFAEGTVWDTAAIQASAVAGTANAMTGTAGDDIFVVDHTGDTISEGANQGTDTVQTSVSYALPADVENIEATGYLNIDLTGNALANTLTGNAGMNWLSGEAGDDTLNGGAGGDRLYGGTGNDALSGGPGDDLLADGAGSNTLAGGSGDNTYDLTYGYASYSYSSVMESANEGIDTVITRYDYTLPANVENLMLRGGYDGYRAIGNVLDNLITVENNIPYDTVIDGGAGADTMIMQGSAGGTFYVDNPDDKVFGGYRSKVVSSVDWASTGHVDELQLAAGSAAVTATGDDFDNVLGGNQNANILYGLGGDDSFRGGLGVDTYVGGTGDDIYYIESGHYQPYTTIPYVDPLAPVPQFDTIVEAAGEGIDTVHKCVRKTDLSDMR